MKQNLSFLKYMKYYSYEVNLMIMICVLHDEL